MTVKTQKYYYRPETKKMIRISIELYSVTDDSNTRIYEEKDNVNLYRKIWIHYGWTKYNSVFSTTSVLGRFHLPKKYVAFNQRYIFVSLLLYILHFYSSIFDSYYLFDSPRQNHMQHGRNVVI